MRILLLAVIVSSVACNRIADSDPIDYTEEVERICLGLCEMNVACHEPPLFETVEECEAVCLDIQTLYDDTNCGSAGRDLYDCVAATTTCEMYNDTNNVNAEDYTCKAEKDRLASLTCVADSGPPP